MRKTILIAGLFIAAPVHAELRDFCANRPGLDTPPCTVDPGHVMVETGLADWSVDSRSDQRTDTVTAGNALVRVGLGPSTEAQIGWTAYGHVRTRDRMTGAINTDQGTGDVILGFKQGVAGANGPVAVQGFVTVPVGGSAIGAGDWGAGLIVPMQFDLGHRFALALSPEIDAAVDSDGSGRHLAYGCVAGISVPLTGELGLSIEFEGKRDEDPSGRSTRTYASQSLAWQSGKTMQFDLGAVEGLDHDAADFELYAGMSRRF